MRAQLRRKTRFYFCPEERDGAPKNSKLGVTAQHHFLGTCVDSVCGNGEAELLSQALRCSTAYDKLTLRETLKKRKQKSLSNDLLVDWATYLERQ